MTVSEFSDGFDVLVNSYRRIRSFDNQEATDSIEFNEYEKSFYLTKAQEEFVRSLYNGRNPSGLSFEETEEQRRLLSNLIGEALLDKEDNPGIIGMRFAESAVFTLDPDLWFITYEEATVDAGNGKCGGNLSQEVVPVTQDEFHRIKKNPFRGINRRRALRLDLSEGNVEIICKYPVTSYYLRYLRKPNPIVLSAMDADAAIEGVITPTECELPESLHQRILERAVIMALQSKGININENK
jgi:hypothetical protein